MMKYIIKYCEISKYVNVSSPVMTKLPESIAVSWFVWLMVNVLKQALKCKMYDKASKSGMVTHQGTIRNKHIKMNRFLKCNLTGMVILGCLTIQKILSYQRYIESKMKCFGRTCKKGNGCWLRTATLVSCWESIADAPSHASQAFRDTLPCCWSQSSGEPTLASCSHTSFCSSFLG